MYSPAALGDLKLLAGRDLSAGDGQIAEIRVILKVLLRRVEGLSGGLPPQESFVEHPFEAHTGCDLDRRFTEHVHDGTVRPVGLRFSSFEHRLRTTGGQEQDERPRPDHLKQPLPRDEVRPRPTVLKQETPFLRTVTVEEHKLGPQPGYIALESLERQPHAADDPDRLIL